jgi:hypothetical protein
MVWNLFGHYNQELEADASCIFKDHIIEKLSSKVIHFHFPLNLERKECPH